MLRARALKQLARREHARGELALKLGARGGDGGEIERVLAALEAEGLLSEERFTAHYVESRIGRGQGPLRIGEELRRRGVGGPAARAALDRVPGFWPERASQERARRFGEAMPAEYREWVRQARFLERRGFTQEQIRSALGPPP